MSWSLRSPVQVLKRTLAKFKPTTPSMNEFVVELPMFAPPTRRVERVFIHCSASDAHNSVATIRMWHKLRGFRDIGYHYFIDREGMIHAGRDIEEVPAAQEGHNQKTLAVCVDGLSNFTPESLLALSKFCHSIHEAYRDVGKRVTFHGHREVNPHKTCPVFDYKTLLGLNERGEIV